MAIIHLVIGAPGFMKICETYISPFSQSSVKYILDLQV